MRKIVFLFLFLLLHGILHIASGQNTFIIKGRITDTKGSAIPGAGVTIENSLYGVHADIDGNFQLPALRHGTYILHVSSIGYEPVSKEINLTSSQVVDISLPAKTYMTEEVLVSATRAGENTPLTYSTVTKDEISKVNIARDIPYLLSNTPSLVTSSDAGTGVGYTYINIRGTDVKRINVTIDGIPVNDAESHGVWWVDLPDIASSADNIQVQRGVGTSTNGAGAFGATINFQTSDVKNEPYAEINSSYGSFNTSKNSINFGTGLIDKKFAIDGRLSRIWSDGYIDRAFSDLKSFYVSGTVYGEKSLLKFMVFSGEEHTYQAWEGVPKDSLRTHRTYNPYSYKNQTDNYWQDNYQLHYSREISNVLHANIALHYTKGKGYYENLENDKSFASYGLPDIESVNDTIRQSDFITQKWLRSDFYGITYSLELKKEKINAIFGGGWNHYFCDHYGDIIWAKTVNFDGESYQWYHGTGNKKDFNTFFKFNYSITGKLNLYTDLQFRNINYSIGGYNVNLRNVTQEHIYNFFNPKAGLVYNIDNSQKLYGSFGVSQREPARDDFTDADPGKTPVPEKLLDYEAGYELQTGKLMVRGDIYYMYYIDQLILTGKINDVGSTILTNVPKSYRQGIEVENGIQILDNLKWYWNMTLSRNIIPQFTDFTDNWDTGGQDKRVLKNKTISFSPSVIAGSDFDYYPVKGIHLNLSSKYVGKQYIDDTEDNDRMLNSFMVHNVSLIYTLKNRLFREMTFQFVINNILNNKYETNAWVYKYIEEGVQHVMDGYFPQAGINYMFRIGIKI